MPLDGACVLHPICPFYEPSFTNRVLGLKDVLGGTHGVLGKRGVGLEETGGGARELPSSQLSHHPQQTARFPSVCFRLVEWFELLSDWSIFEICLPVCSAWDFRFQQGSDCTAPASERVRSLNERKNAASCYREKNDEKKALTFSSTVQIRESTSTSRIS